MPRARAAMARTKGSASLSALRSALRSAALMISYSSATRSCQPLAKFSSLGGYSSLRYFSRGEVGWAQPACGRNKSPARAMTNRFIRYAPFPSDSRGKLELPVVGYLAFPARYSSWRSREERRVVPEVNQHQRSLQNRRLAKSEVWKTPGLF